MPDETDGVEVASPSRLPAWVGVNGESCISQCISQPCCSSHYFPTIYTVTRTNAPITTNTRIDLSPIHIPWAVANPITVRIANKMVIPIPIRAITPALI